MRTKIHEPLPSSYFTTCRLQSSPTKQRGHLQSISRAIHVEELRKHLRTNTKHNRWVLRRVQCGWEGLQLAGRFSNSGVQISLNKAQTTTNSNPRSCHSRETRIPFSFMSTTASRHPHKASIGHRHGAISCYLCAAPDQQNHHQSLVNGLSSSRRRYGTRRSRSIGAIVGVPLDFAKYIVGTDFLNHILLYIDWDLHRWYKTGWHRMSPGCRQCRLEHHRLRQPQHELLLSVHVEYELLVNANAKDALKTGISACRSSPICFQQRVQNALHKRQRH